MQLAEDFVLSFHGTSNQNSKNAANKLFPDRIAIPLSFTYGDRPSSEFLQGWTVQHTSRPVTGVGTEHETTYSDSATHLTIRVVAQQFSRFPAVEWIVYFQNKGNTPSPILQDILPLDTALACTHSSNAVIHYGNGGRATAEDFKPLQR
jgi:hypothetical protein